MKVKLIDWHVYVIAALVLAGAIYFASTYKLTCSDGTLAGACSAKSTGYLCDSTAQLVFFCQQCGCGSGLICSNNACITQEQQTTDLVANLQQSVVKIIHSFASGSGIILDQADNKTIILTNEHVIDAAKNTADVVVNTNDGFSSNAEDIRVAPSGMDLAVVIISGVHGKTASINHSIRPLQGDSVFALGSPEGILGSVSKGIVSNIKSTTITDTNFRYNVIQTDAAINPGNSGGGLFLSDGVLIGINQFILTTSGGSQGLNFAIDISVLQNLTSYNSWTEFTPVPRCSDGTPYSTCTSAAGLYCGPDGKLVPNCKICGCPTNYPYCPSDGLCFSCPVGTIPAEDSNGHGQCGVPSSTTGG